MKINVDYDKLVGEVLGGCVETAKQTLPILLKKHEDAQSILREHARRYMEAEDEYGLYPPFRDFAEALFRFAELPFHFIDTHRKPRPNDRPEKGNPKRKLDRKSTRLNSSHQIISYAVFCLKKKKNNNNATCRLTTSCLHSSD